MRAFLANRNGVAGIEFALIAPLMILAVLGTFEVGRYVRASTRVADAASSLADLVGQQTSVTSSSMTNFCNGSLLTLAPLATSTFAAAVASVTYYSSTGTRTSDWQDVTCGSATAMTNQVTLATPLTPNTGDSVIVVKATYVYTLSFATVLGSSLSITRFAYARPRTNATVSHS